jgi:hypothetical protein
MMEFKYVNSNIVRSNCGRCWVFIILKIENTEYDFNLSLDLVWKQWFFGGGFSPFCEKNWGEKYKNSMDLKK